MSTIGPLVTVPWGLTLYCLIGILVFVIIAEIWWKRMPHYPEDEQSWEEGNQFVLMSDEDFEKSQAAAKANAKAEKGE